MPRRDVVIEIFAPTEGIHTELPSTMITPRSTPSCNNANAYYGMVQKEYGTSLFATATIGAAVSLIYEAPYPGQSMLQAFNATGMYNIAGGTASNDGQLYTGTFADFWSAVMHNNALIYSNGKDLLQYKAAYNATGTEMGGVASGSYKALGLVSFKDHLNLYHTTEGANSCPKRVRWSKVGLLAYASADWSAGTAGFLDLQDADGDILAAEKLGNGAVGVYAENSVHIQEWVGGASVYQFTKVLTDVNIPTKRCIAAKEATHYILTRNGVFEYEGGITWKDISTPIRADFSYNVNNSCMDKAFIQYVRDEDEIRAYVPTASATLPNTVYICKLRDNYAWYKAARNYTACGRSIRPSNLTIGALVGNIGAQNWKFGDMMAAAGAPVYLLGDASGRLVKMDHTVYSISESGTSTPQSFVFNTKEISSMNDIDPLTKSRYEISKYMYNYSRWIGAALELKGYGSAYLQYSVDGGTTFTNFPESPVTLSNSWTLHRLDLDVAEPSIMIRVSNSATNEVVHCRYVRATLVPGSEIG